MVVSTRRCCMRRTRIATGIEISTLISVAGTASQSVAAIVS